MRQEVGCCPVLQPEYGDLVPPEEGSIPHGAAEHLPQPVPRLRCTAPFAGAGSSRDGHEAGPREAPGVFRGVQARAVGAPLDEHGHRLREELARVALSVLVEALEHGRQDRVPPALALASRWE
jgi:hypothetical protein